MPLLLVLGLVLLLTGGCAYRAAMDAPAAPGKTPDQSLHRPLSLPEAKEAVAHYYEHGGWERDVARVAMAGERFVLERLEVAQGRPAVVFDLDETLVSSYAVQKEMNLGQCFDPALWQAFVERASAPAIGPMLRLYNGLRERGAALFIITARRERYRGPTGTELARAGYAGWQELILRPDGFQGSSQEFKEGARRRIEAAGYDILASFGDQESDLAGCCAEKTFKLPNLLFRLD